ncbi:DUF4232 domain-containing protein [Streptomyces sp. NPDC058108]|uniref:DUF4232 domain-containing protein n=1 Tax=Streptomyces sp. NPDC058108 TaxID=3346344 RepID=UPI0036E6CB5D
MRYRTGIRRASAALVSVSAVTALLTGCQPGGDTTGSASASDDRTGGTGSSSPTASASASGTSRPARTPDPTAGDPSPGSSSGTATGTTTACAADDLDASMHQAAVRPPGTGTGAVIVEFTNVSGRPCAVRGRPEVAGAGNGSPRSNRPLEVTPTGISSEVLLAPGGKTWTKLTFVQVQGEGDGYCVSGARPVTFPTLVIGLPGSGSHQVALDDGVVAECDNRVTVTALQVRQPV